MLINSTQNKNNPYNNTSSRNCMRAVVHEAVRDKDLPKESIAQFERIGGDNFQEFLREADRTSKELISKGRSRSRGGLLRVGLGTALAIGMANASPFAGTDLGLSLKASSFLLKAGMAVGGLSAVVGVTDIVKSRKFKAEGELINDMTEKLIHTQSCHNGAASAV